LINIILINIILINIILINIILINIILINLILINLILINLILINLILKQNGKILTFFSKQLLGATTLHIDNSSASVADPSGKFKVVYSSPLVRLPHSKRTSSLPLDWDSDTSSLVVTLPSLEVPIILAFGLIGPTPEVEEKRGHQLSFPSFVPGLCFIFFIMSN
jgi:hypothetical protein